LLKYLNQRGSEQRYVLDECKEQLRGEDNIDSDDCLRETKFKDIDISEQAVLKWVLGK
jgi:hypothetical protein